MSKIYKDFVGRKSKKEILYLYNRLSNIFSNYIIEGTNKIPELYEDKKDFGDIDFFGQLKDNIILTERNILNILSDNGFIVGEKLKKILINNYNIEGADKIPVIYKNDLEYTLLAYDTNINQFFHIDLHLINEKIDGVVFQSYFEYYRKPFFSYHLGIILRKFGIKYSSKGIFYRLPQEIFGQDKEILVTKNLYDFLKWLNFYFSDLTFLDSYNNIATNEDIINTIYKLYIFDYRFFLYENIKYEERRKIKSYKINKELNNLILKNKVNNIEERLIQLYNTNNIFNLISEFKKDIKPELISFIEPKETDLVNYYLNKFNQFNQRGLTYTNLNIGFVALFILYSLLTLYKTHNFVQIEFLEFIKKIQRKKQEQIFKEKLYLYLFGHNYKKELGNIYKNRQKNQKIINKIEKIIQNFEDYYDFKNNKLLKERIDSEFF